jgi:hypothetical protein
MAFTLIRATVGSPQDLMAGYLYIRPLRSDLKLPPPPPVLITYSAEDFCDASGNEIGVCLADCGAGIGCAANCFADSLTVKTEQGKVTGKTINDGKVKAFLGLPYAAPPVGDLRWKAPQPPAKWKGERDATNSARTARRTMSLTTWSSRAPRQARIACS